MDALSVATYAAAVATYAAVVGTVSLAWNIYIGLRDRPRLSLKAAVHTVHEGLGLTTNNGKAVLLTASNRGRRPITIVHAGWDNANGTAGMLVADPSVPVPVRMSKGLIAPELPLTLTESQRTQFAWPLDTFGNRAPVNFHVHDAHGTIYRLGFFARRRILKQLQKSIGPGR